MRSVLADTPGTPSRPEVSEINDHSCTLTWSAPPHDGGSPITNYIIEQRRPEDLRWSQVDRILNTTYRVKNLIEGQRYDFRIIAENKAGPSQPSQPSITVKYGKAYIYQ